MQFKLLQTADGSGKGAALITAIIARLSKRDEQQQQYKTNEHVVAVGQNVQQISEMKENSNKSMNENQKVNLVSSDVPSYDSFNGEVENGVIHLSTP